MDEKHDGRTRRWLNGLLSWINLICLTLLSIPEQIENDTVILEKKRYTKVAEHAPYFSLTVYSFISYILFYFWVTYCMADATNRHMKIG